MLIFLIPNFRVDKMVKIYIFILILIFISLNSGVSSLSLDPTEEQLLNGLISAMGVNMIGFPTISPGVYDFCNDTQYYFKCMNISNKIVLYNAILTQTNLVIVSANNFSFSNLNYLDLTNCYLSSDFLSSVKTPTINLNECNVISIESPIEQTHLIISNPPSFQGEFKFSYLNKYDSYFEILPYKTFGEISVTYVNDLQSDLYIDILSLVSNSIPSFTNVNVKELSLFLTDSYVNSNKSNYSTMTKVEELKLFNNLTIDFPLFIFYIQNSIITTLQIGGMLNEPSEMIEIPQNNNITTLLIDYSSPYFSLNGSIPFTSFPNIQTFYISGGNYSNEKDLSKFQNVSSLTITNSNLRIKLQKYNFQYLDLSSNKISGTVDQSYCTRDPSNLLLKNNNLSGILPSCFSCYGDSNFLGNDNLVREECTSISVNIYVDKVNKKLIMWGNDIGFNTHDFIMDPPFSWKVVVPSYRFEANYFFNSELPKNGMFIINFLAKKNIIKKVNATLSSPPPSCYRDCTIGEYCDSATLTCLCAAGWSGDDCSINTNIYVTSIDSVDEKGGDITLYGWFSNTHYKLNVTIDNKDCPVIQNTITNVSIQCTVSAGTGKKSILIQQNNLSWSGFFTYEINVKSCLNNCSKNGDCITSTGECNCRSGFKGFDCSIVSGGNGLPSTNTTIDNNGTTIINNQKTSYQILITKLIEFDVEKNIIQEYTLDNKWIVSETNTDSNENNNNNNNIVYQFSQTLVQSLTNCTISYTVEEIKEKSKQYSFAGYNLTLDSGSVKISVSIYNYQYGSSLNNLQLQFQSSVASDSNDCNKQDTDIQNSNNDLLNYITIKKDSKIMQARFLNRILSDGRSSIITSEVVSKLTDSVTIGLNLPYCTNCLIDPDFSVLIVSSFKGSCGENERPAYLIPVIVVSGVIGVALVVGLSYYIYKKKFVENQLSKKLKKIENQH
ncbi:hypothetical protein RB653_009051 [Dictyostelium firmibasis]|uniref:EGF-like domain-containing protein n=1 Tax=Dictyostelium firmibasis TaxID=79012 RepID=A0AAN7TTH1_9MYCE